MARPARTVHLSFGNFRALRHPPFRNYWLAQLLSLLGTWAQTTAQSYLILQLSHNSATALAMVTVTRFVPTLLLTLVAGAIIDRTSRRTVLLITQSVLLLTSLALAVATQTGQITVTAVLGLSLLAGFANAFDMPARQSMAADFVPREDVPNAVALNSLSFNTARALGQALFGVVAGAGALLFGQAGGVQQLAFSFYLNAASFVVVILVIARLPFPRREAAVRTPLLGDVRAGLRYVRGTPSIWYTLLIVGVLSLTIINYNVVIPYFARAVFGLQETGFGLLNGVFGVGAMLSALGLTTLTAPLRTLRWGVLLISLFTALLAVTPSPWLAVPVLLACGAAQLLVTVSANSATQLSVPDALRGRVMSVYTFVLGGANPFGALFAGAFINAHTRLGPRIGLLAVVVLGAVPALALLTRLPRTLPQLAEAGRPARKA